MLKIVPISQTPPPEGSWEPPESLDYTSGISAQVAPDPECACSSLIQGEQIRGFS